MNWFTSDLHLDGYIQLGSNELFQYWMLKHNDYTQTIIEEWNESVKPDDVVYVLGDLCWDPGLARQLTGRLVWIKGNHDAAGGTRIKSSRIELDGKRVLLQHYPAISRALWNEGLDWLSKIAKTSKEECLKVILNERINWTVDAPIEHVPYGTRTIWLKSLKAMHNMRPVDDLTSVDVVLHGHIHAVENILIADIKCRNLCAFRILDHSVVISEERLIQWLRR